MPVSVPATDLIGSQFAESTLGKKGEVVGHGGSLRPVDLEAGTVEPHQGPGSDTADHDPVDGVPAEGSHGIAGAMGVMLIAIDDILQLLRVGIDDHELRRRTEMAVDRAIQAFIFGNGKTDFHGEVSFILFCAYAQHISQIASIVNPFFNGDFPAVL
jgi:hypothetical protein